MAIDLAEYERLKQQVDKLRRNHDRAEGALSGLLGRLESEHGCKTLKAAERKSAKLEALADTAEQEADEALQQFKEKWEGKL